MRAAAIDDAIDDLVGDRLEDEGAGLLLDAVRAIRAARRSGSLDAFADGIALCCDAADALDGVADG